jgi:hypothetical protein
MSAYADFYDMLREGRLSQFVIPGSHIWTGPRILFLDDKCCTGSLAEWTCSSEHAAVDPLEQSVIFW